MTRLDVADTAGVFGAIAAALCCAGTPLVVSALGVVGLTFLRRDAILWPVMLVSLMLALWGFGRGTRVHHNAAPLSIGVLGALSLSLGVIVVHGYPAMQMIYGGAIALILATVWNIQARRQIRRP